MKGKIILRTLQVFLLLMLSITSFAFSVKAENEIQAYDGQISETNILRNSNVNIYATLVNLGNKTILVHSLNAEFINADGLTKYNKLYTVKYDQDYRELNPGESITGTLNIKVTNAEGSYNVSIFFKATDVYSADNPLGEAPILNYTTGNIITVKVYDRANATGIVAGIGFTFLGIVGVVTLFILYGWIKERMTKKKYA
ncbi:MAG: hypothetical protein ACTSQE_09735 [Candidatus Heimdallarchaeaceae archaeon]